MDILEWVLGVFFLMTGLLKLFGHAHMKKEFRRFQYPFWLMRLAGAIETVAAPGLLLGLWLPMWTLLGAVLLSCVMVGATYINFTKRPPAFGWGTLVILGLCVLVVWGRRDLISPWI
ncbi:MAG TPA: DoxX family protein [Dongiaceae bacterium]|nr:DoxX family protein [Dongiaceae bacterium]